MKNYFSTALFVSVLLLSMSCVSRKEITYFLKDNIDQSKVSNHYKTIIKPDDLLLITIKALDTEGVALFNSKEEGADERTYLVDSYGYIDFPIIGKLSVAGLTKEELITLLKTKLDPDYIKSPTINIRLSNFKFSVLGAVNVPGSYTIPNERITILEGIALAGDLNIAGKRNNILLIREENGKKNQYQIDLSSKALFTSPVYYLQQNDVIYVEHNYARIQSASSNVNTSLFISFVSVIVVLISNLF